MATLQATQTVLGNNPGSPRLIRQVGHGTNTLNYVQGGALAPGRTRWIQTITSDSDATQGAAILAALVL